MAKDINKLMTQLDTASGNSASANTAKDLSTQMWEYRKAAYTNPETGEGSRYAMTHRETKEYNEGGYKDNWTVGDKLYQVANRAYQAMTGKRLSQDGIYSPEVANQIGQDNILFKDLTPIVEEALGLSTDGNKKPGSGSGSGAGSYSGATASSASGAAEGISSYDDIMKLIKDTTEANNEWSAREAQKNRDWQTEMSNTAHQREMADLQAAGLNPVLTASGGSGASVGSSGIAQADTSNTRELAAVALAALENAQVSAGALGAVAKTNSNESFLSKLMNNKDVRYLARGAASAVIRRLIWKVI